MQIDIDFEVYKALTARRQHENHSYNEVLRDLLGIEFGVSGATVDTDSDDGQVKVPALFALRGGGLPDGTELKALYKGTEYRASIRNGRWVDSSGIEHSSPSAAASAISGTNVNGLRFWHAKRPADTVFRRLDILLAMQP
ncbi:hypothetical protein U1839_10420 [Sphingomonas sp. RT2P30]|uniref:hypothetical protein n=1 Tax=Parasphingomonas halimpatiens TaxID=3096162 RepID=UPI002FCC2EDE